MPFSNSTPARVLAASLITAEPFLPNEKQRRHVIEHVNVEAASPLAFGGWAMVHQSTSTGPSLATFIRRM
jgi:hypothetical protein